MNQYNQMEGFEAVAQYCIQVCVCVCGVCVNRLKEVN